MRVLLVGANRGLGLEMTRYLSQVEKASVTGTCRTSNDDLDGIASKVVSGVDLNNDDRVEVLLKGLEGDAPFHRVYIVAGYFYTGETSFDTLNIAEERRMMEICAYAPVHIVAGLATNNLINAETKICFVTSEGGSIALRSDEEGGGHYGHHMSKAAANMAGRMLAIDLKPKGIPLVMVHPGFMKTTMTEHYSHLYEQFGAVTPAEACPAIVKACEDATLEKSGCFIAPHGAASLGLGAAQLPSDFKPFDCIPW